MRKALVLPGVCLALILGLAASACQSDTANQGVNANSDARNSNELTKSKIAAAAGGPRLTISSAGKETPLEVKTGTYQKSIVNYLAGGKNETASETVFVIANFDLGAAKAGGKPENGQLVAAFTLIGASGSDDKTALPTGTYLVRSGVAENAARFNITTKCGFVSFANGIQADKKLATSKLQGETKITAVTAATIAGEINVTDGETTIKGTFIAKPGLR